MFISIELHLLFCFFLMLSSIPSILDVNSLAAGTLSKAMGSIPMRYIGPCCFEGCNFVQHVFFTVYGKLGNGKPVSPLILFFEAIYSKELLNLLIDNFHLTICLGVERC